MHRTDLTSLIPDFIADAEARIYRDLRIRAMETAFSSAIASGTVSVPTGFIEWKYLYINGSSAQKLTRKDPEYIYTTYPTRTGNGKPVFFAREADTLIFGPYPDSAYTVKGIYYKRLPALSDTNTTNWFITDAPDLLRYAALSEAAQYIRDDAHISLFEGKYNATKDAIQRTDKRESNSGAVLSMSAG
jgi:hypothetical protein